MPNTKVYVNRTLNLKKIKYIGLDMDHTLIRYNTENFERLSHKKIMEKLVAGKNYPEQIKKLQFVFDFALRGLVVDRQAQASVVSIGAAQGNCTCTNQYIASLEVLGDGSGGNQGRSDQGCECKFFHLSHPILSSGNIPETIGHSGKTLEFALDQIRKTPSWLHAPA